jgi:hypothetical protein
MMECLAVQFDALRAEGQILLYLEEDDIEVLENGWYLIRNDEHVTTCDDNHVELTKPITQLIELPEIKRLGDEVYLPCTLRESAVYYIVGKMMIRLLDMDEQMESIVGSPLYFAIRRCFEPDPSKRHFVLV